MTYPLDYRWFWRCGNCGVKWPYDFDLEEEEEGFTLCPLCYCHLSQVTDIEKMRKEGNWKGDYNL